MKGIVTKAEEALLEIIGRSAQTWDTVAVSTTCRPTASLAHDTAISLREGVARIRELLTKQDARTDPIVTGAMKNAGIDAMRQSAGGSDICDTTPPEILAEIARNVFVAMISAKARE